MAAEDFKCLRDSIIDGKYLTDELSLGVPWAVVQQLCWFRGGKLGGRAGLGTVTNTVFGQRVVVENHVQKTPYDMHRCITSLYAILAFFNRFLGRKKEKIYSYEL